MPSSFGFWGERRETSFEFFSFPTGGIKADKLSLVSEPDCVRVIEVFGGNPIMPPNSSFFGIQHGEDKDQRELSDAFNAARMPKIALIARGLGGRD